MTLPCKYICLSQHLWFHSASNGGLHFGEVVYPSDNILHPRCHRKPGLNFSRELESYLGVSAWIFSIHVFQQPLNCNISQDVSRGKLLDCEFHTFCRNLAGVIKRYSDIAGPRYSSFAIRCTQYNTLGHWDVDTNERQRDSLTRAADTRGEWS